MGIEIIDHQANHLSLGKMDVHQLLYLLGEIPCRALGRDIDLTPAAQRLHEEKQIGRPLTAIFIGVAGRLSRSGGQRLAHLADELDRTLIETDLRALRIIGSSEVLAVCFSRVSSKQTCGRCAS